MHGSRVAALVLAGCSGAASTSTPPPVAPAPVAASSLRAPADFAAIADGAARSRALFGEMSRVLLHPRCVNCHPADDTPRQRDAHELHDPPVVRGSADRGVPAMACTTCHQDRNAELARVPGAPDWHLAPLAMAWLDRTPSQVCTQLKDPARNGHRTLAQVVDHLGHDPLVGWAWAPGADRAPAPGTQAELAALAQAWLDSGAECP
jgi:cytochrome c553